MFLNFLQEINQHLHFQILSYVQLLHLQSAFITSLVFVFSHSLVELKAKLIWVPGSKQPHLWPQGFTFCSV